MLHAALLAITLAGGGVACVSESPPSRVPYELRGLAERSLAGSEKDVLESKGFVLSTIEPLSFHEGYAALYRAHEPVYFTADAVLHAMHTSFDAILAEIETEVLTHELATALDGLRDGLAKSTSAPPDARAGMDVYLTVAKSLLDGKEAPLVAGGDAALVQSVVAKAKEASGPPVQLALFGQQHPFDFSMMKPRGHYTQSETLSRYFQAMMWLGTVDIRLAQQVQGVWKVDRGAVRAAALFHELATPAVQLAWRTIDKTSEALVGPADSMSLPGLSRALAALQYPVTALESRQDSEIVAALLPESQQRIRGGLMHQGEKGIAFLLLGQRFVFDSLVFTKTVYDAIPGKRLMPSPLDVGAAVLKNPVAEKLLEPELEQYEYRDQLRAVAKEGDSLGSAVWEGSVYHGWLHALSRLSPDPAKDKGLPSVFQTEQWQKRMLSTQLASWAELRHDTVLYAKQSYTMMLGCDYPDGYVDPYPEFFAAIEKMAKNTKTMVGGLPFGSKKALQERIGKYFELLAEVAKKLGHMAALERENLPLGSDDVAYLKAAVAMQEINQVCTVTYEPEGWHADLYYDRSEIMKRAPIVSDVHTQPTDEDGNMVGRVLQVGTGYPRQITIRIDLDTGPRTYRGMVGSYYETISTGFNRLNDQEWREKLKKDPPPDPAWLSDLIVSVPTATKR